MKSSHALILSLVLTCCASFFCTPVIAATKIADELADQANSLIESSIRDGVHRDAVNHLFRRAVLVDGSVEPILNWLTESRGNLNEPRGKVIAELEVHFASRRGDLQRASDVLNKLLKVKDFADQRSDLQIWQAKLYDALGDVEEAKKVYQQLTKQELSEADQQSVRLRLSLMGLIGSSDNRNKVDAKPLIELANKSKDTAFRNRAANVLAVQNQHAEAIKLFTIEGEGTVRFRSASRLTEWAIRAKDRDKAIEAAWDAVNSSELKRDRNYALALLVESYRLKEAKKGLEKLVEKLNEKNEANEPMTDEMRTVWISLLRELGKHEEAIKLFKATADSDSGFTVEMRRELLKMEGQAGHEDRMLQSYRELIKSEPNELAWRAGLTQILLEKGQDDDAKALWIDYIQELDRGSLLLMSAQTLGEYGLDDLASQTVERMVTLRANHGQALLYWADLQKRRGNVDQAEATLDRVLQLNDVGDAVRAELASAYERLGRQDKAIEVNEAIRAGRETVAEDLEMRLAWLYSEIGDEEKALEQWLALWRKITSIPRRRYVEDRLMTVASRLGTLADIAIDLEEKLADGTADDREAGLLVRIYSRVNDSVAATEIAEEYMAKTGKNEVEQLQEKGRIYQICNDYWNYEQVIERLIEVDPDGETEYLRQLALSMLERGKAQEARAVLMTLRSADDGKDSIGGEFEAGVLSLVGMNAEAANAYRKGIATYPDRIESYLLLANLLKEMGQTDRAIGMFQYLAENADRDDLFTIAIDGLLNMEAKGHSMQWARRITLERLAGREDKNYLYQLLSDLSSEVNDKSGQIRAMENSLAVSGTRRLSVLRECMELSSKIRGGVYYSSSSRGPTNKGNEPFFAFGRRLIGLGELMPPQVFLDLGQAFLDDGDTGTAERTFAMARNLADPRSYQREVAAIFEKAGKISEALVRYEKLLRTSPSDVALMARVAKLNEQQGNDDIAFRFYQRGLNLLISQTPLTTQEEKKQTTSYWSSNRDAYQTYSERLLQGMLVTAGDDQVDKLLDSQLQRLSQSLQELDQAVKNGRVAEKVGDSPRIDKQSTTLRRMYFACDRIAELESMDQLLIGKFSSDKGLAIKFARERIQRGRYDSVRRMLATFDSSDENSDQRSQLLTMLGDKSNESETAKLSPKEMWQRFLPVWMKGDNVAARNILRRVDQMQGRAPGSRPSYVVINGMAVLQNSGSASDVASWMRLAISLGDEGLALQFARSRLKSGGRYGTTGISQLFDTYKSILPEKPFVDLVRYAANTYKEDESRLADYLWLVSNMREHLDDLPSDEKMLEIIEDSDLKLGYYFPFALANEVFPESIRPQAMAKLLDGITKKYRPRELIRIPFTHNKPIDEETAKVVLESLESGIDAALQDNYLRYCTYYLPRTGTAVKCPENTEFALAALELLMTDKVRKREDTIPKMCEYIKAVVLHQAGKTDEALEIALKLYDPDNNPTDYYMRYARDWVQRELIPAATEQFVALVDEKIKDGKPTTKQTDARLQLIKQAGDESLLRAAYQRAVQDHPDQSKYATEYEKWEQRSKRVAVAIALNEQRLLTATKSEKGQSTAIAIKTRLGDLWFSVNHRPNGLPYWRIKDDQDREKFDAEREKRAQAKLEAAKPEAAKTEDKKPKPKKEDESSNKKVEVEKPKKKYPSTIVGVKAAIKDEDTDAARQTIRKLWRKLPPAVASPYGYRTSQKGLNGLKWPADAKPKDIKATEQEKSDEEQLAAAEAAWRKARGGLATFTPPEPAPAKQTDSAWKVLASHPFAVAEMQRIMRAQTSPKIANVSDVSIALLHAERLQYGDDAVFASLVEKIHAGHISDEVLARMFAMLEEDHGRINQKNKAVVDVLLERLDLTNGKRASQLAELCARIGQRDRAAALYRHCALLTTTGSISLASLIKQARETFEGDELMELAESMFAVTNQDASSSSEILQLRAELLDAKTAADRSRDLLDGDITATNPTDLAKVIRAVPVFSRAGEYGLAEKCLAVVLRQHGQPRISASSSYSYYSSSNSRNLLNVSRSDQIRMFPADSAGYQNYDDWLTKAATVAIDLYDTGDAKPEIVVETLLTIALRQCERENKIAAAHTLSFLTDAILAEAKKHELLAIDVMRLAGCIDQALELQTRIHADQRLSHLRFGDYLRDTNTARGQTAAAYLLEQLVTLSMDEDLLVAATEIAVDDIDLMRRVEELQSQWQLAEQDYRSRTNAAKQRAETRKQWKEADKAKVVLP